MRLLASPAEQTLDLLETRLSAAAGGSLSEQCVGTVLVADQLVVKCFPASVVKETMQLLGVCWRGNADISLGQTSNDEARRAAGGADISLRQTRNDEARRAVGNAEVGFGQTKHDEARQAASSAEIGLGQTDNDETRRVAGFP